MGRRFNMTIYSLHLVQPDDTDIELMSEELQSTLKEFFTEYPSAVMYNSHPVDGKHIIHVRVQHDEMTEELLLNLFLLYGLDWEVLGIREDRLTPAELDSEGEEITPAFYNVIKQIDKATLLPYMNDIHVDEETTRPVEMADTLYLSMYAGTAPLEI